MVIKVSKDAELDRLKAAQNDAYHEKQSAYHEMMDAWDRLLSARESLNQAYIAMHLAYDEHEVTWKHFQDVRTSKMRLIRSLSTQQQVAYKKMKQAFESTALAKKRGDRASVKRHSNKGRSFATESNDCIAKRSQLMDDIRTARAQHEAGKPAFQRAKDKLTSAKREFDSAKADHERLRSDFKHAKSELDKTRDEFIARLAIVKEKDTKNDISNDPKRSSGE